MVAANLLRYCRLSSSQQQFPVSPVESLDIPNCLDGIFLIPPVSSGSPLGSLTIWTCPKIKSMSGKCAKATGYAT